MKTEQLTTQVTNQDNQELIELALQFPFYRWFYTEKTGIGDLDKITYKNAPVLEKKYFFEYEEAFGEPYYTGMKESDDTYTERTSGTTGKPLEMIRPYTNLQLLYQILGEALHRYLHTKPVMITQGYESGTWNIYWVQFPKRKEYKKVGSLITVANVPFKQILDPDEVSAHIKAHGANVLFDPTGQWTYTLLKKDAPLKKLGIKVIMVLNPDPGVWNELVKNFEWCGMYGGTDGCGSTTCPYLERPGMYHPHEEYAEVYVLDNGTVKEFGEGLLVVNKYHNQLFPFIKYIPHDMVKLEQRTCQCGKEKILYMRGRAAREVRVPEEFETVIRLDDVESILSPEGPYLMTYSKIKDDEAMYGEYRALISFIEKDTISRPELNKKLTHAITDAHKCEYSDYALPVILVPEGTFTHTQMKDLKLRTFFDTVRMFPKQYLNLVDIAREVGYDIVVPEARQ